MNELVQQNPAMMGYSEANNKMIQISTEIDASIAELKERFNELSQSGLQENQETLELLMGLWKEAKSISGKYKPSLEQITQFFHEMHRATVGKRDEMYNRPLNALKEINEAVNRIADAIEKARKEAARKEAEAKRAQEIEKEKELKEARQKEAERLEAERLERENKDKKEREEIEEKERNAAVGEQVEEKIDINRLVQERQAEANRLKTERDARLLIEQKAAELAEAAFQSRQAILTAQAPVAPVIPESITYDIKLMDHVEFCRAIASGELLGVYKGKTIFDISHAGIKGIVLGRADMQPKPSRPGDSILDGLRKYGLLITAKAERKIK